MIFNNVKMLVLLIGKDTITIEKWNKLFCIHTGKKLVHWDNQGGLMVHQAWPSRTGTMQQGNITSTFMAPQTVISLVIT
jgi:hypothetical protein